MKSTAELIAHLKAHPGELNYASYGAGSGPHLAAGLFQDITGTKIQHVPYTGGSPATIAVLRGEVQMLLAGILAVGPLVQSGGLKPLAIAAETRTPALPDLPTFREQGIDYLNGTWFGLLAPAKTPPASSKSSIASSTPRCAATRCVRASPSRARTCWAAVRRISPASSGRKRSRLAAVIRRANIQLD